MHAKNKQLEDDMILFKTIQNKETWIKAKHKAFANFATTKFNTKPQKTTQKEKKEFIWWAKFKKCGCKHLADQTYKHANKKCDKCHQKKHISRFYDRYIFMTKEKTS